MPLIYIALMLEVILLLVLPPHYGILHIQFYRISHHEGVLQFALSYCLVFVLQLLSTGLLVLRRPLLAFLVAALSLALAIGTFNPSRMDIPFHEWLLATAFLWRSPDMLFGSVASRLPLLVGLLLIAVSASKLSSGNPPKSNSGHASRAP